MEGIGIRLTGWEDGQLVEQELQVTDRWTIHTAHEVLVTIQGITVRLVQDPHGLNATRIGVGACVWEGELLLAAYLASLPHHRYMGARVVELGSGPGLAGLLLAKLGAKVVLTDKGCVTELIQKNIDVNGLSDATKRGAETGIVEVRELEWGAEGDDAIVESLAPADWVLAADCCYIDNEGQSPSTPHFMRACRGLCSTNTTCLVSFELRSQLVKEVFLRQAGAMFTKVARIPTTSLPKGCRVEHIELYQLAL